MKFLESFIGVHELLEESKCLKSVVSGSNKEDVDALVKQFKNIEFDVIITADDVSVGKPDSLAFITALRNMNVDKGQAIVIENAPLGIDAANAAGIQLLIVLNNSPLVPRDFEGKIEKSRILKDTQSVSIQLHGWCG